MKGYIHRDPADMFQHLRAVPVPVPQHARAVCTYIAIMAAASRFPTEMNVPSRHQQLLRLLQRLDPLCSKLWTELSRSRLHDRAFAFELPSCQEVLTQRVHTFLIYQACGHNHVCSAAASRALAIRPEM